MQTELDYNDLDTIILDIYKSKPNPKLRRVETFMYAAQAFLTVLPEYFTSLEASTTWVFFWNTLTIKVLGGEIDEQVSDRIVKSLKRLQYSKNGMQGWLGIDYIPHLASTYAAVHALCHIGTVSAYNLINPQKLLNYFIAVKSSSGGFLMHVNGELDVRGTYCILSILDLVQVHRNAKYVSSLKVLLKNVIDYLKNCQTHEGGFGSIPGLEAHGGYTHCAVMSLFILEKWSRECLDDLKLILPEFRIKDAINIKRLKKWCAYRVDWSGGISGRTNKLVDVCYSYWVGSLLVKLNVFPTAAIANNDALSRIYPNITIYDRLQMYIKLISAAPIRDQFSSNPITQGGGFRDKPSKGVDYYHTGYGLSGMSCFQQKAKSLGLSNIKEEERLEKISLIHNCEEKCVNSMQKYFSNNKDMLHEL
eukprot:NODE_213_length_14376_cov_0.499054.p3 type:complete len:419 gc:universal NODE_213_length_14376_cov_0.499054:10291-11547(+)